MNWQPWRWLHRLPRLLDLPRPEPAQQARRIAAFQRNVVLPARFLVVLVTIYYLYFSHWTDEATPSNEVATTYEVVFDTIKGILGFYILFNVLAALLLFTVRRALPGLVQWIVFATGLADGVLLGSLTLLTGGVDSILYWAYPGMIVLNAICIPLAMPQIVLNLVLSGIFLTAGWLELDIRDPGTSAVVSLRTRPERKVGPTILSLEDLKDFQPIMDRFKAGTDPLYRVIGGRLPEATRVRISQALTNAAEAAALKLSLVEDVNRILRRYSAPVTSEPPDYPAEPYLLRVMALWLFTFCCYGVQVLAARQQVAEEEQKEFIARTGQLQTVGRLAAEFAHQIKNPLAIINNAAFSLQRALRIGKADPAKQIEIIQEEVARADQIVTQIMDYAQLSEGRVEKLDVIEELNRAIERVFPPAVPGGVNIHRHYGESFPPLLMQRRHLSETLVNLLQNAREALDGKGNVQVIADSRPDYSVVISIQDDGPGIPADKLEQIFEAYFTTKKRGTGLGLAIVKHNAELYSGTVRVESELGKGARFTVVFPVKSLMKLGK